MDLSNENIIHIKTEKNEYIQFKKLLEYKEIISHAYSLGTNTNFRTAKANKELLSEKEYEKTINDYKTLSESIGTCYENIVKPNQNHTEEVKIVKEKILKNNPDFNLEEYDNTDGIITNQKNIVLSTTNADCILLLFFDPVKKVIANTHSGWRGTLQRISIKTIEKMTKEFGCDAKNIICCICPSIRSCHFEVDKEVKDMFEKEWNIDTVKINKILLERQGLKKENIIDSKICSVCNSDLIHSYRVEKEGYKLNTALIELL